MLSAAAVSLISSSRFTSIPIGLNPPVSSSRNSVQVRPFTVKSTASTAERPRSFCTSSPPPPSSSSTLYQVLGIGRGATRREIKAAYRRLARVLHPDAGSTAQSSSAGEFIKIHDAYETLSDPDKRAAYDRSFFWTGNSMGGVTSGMADCSATRFDRFSRRTWETDQCW